MSKELTEQWKQGKLESDTYYTKIKDTSRLAFVCVNEYFKDDECPEFRDFPDEWIIEVLDKVPTYDQFVELTEKANQFSLMEKKVHILNEANMKLENAIGSQADFFRQKISVLESQLSSISEQLKDANDIIKWYATGDLSDWEYVDGEEVFVEQSAANETDTAEKYLTKYGVEK